MYLENVTELRFIPLGLPHGEKGMSGASSWAKCGPCVETEREGKNKSLRVYCWRERNNLKRI